MNGNRTHSHDQRLLSLGQSYLWSQVSTKLLLGECGLRTNGAQYTIPVVEGTWIGQAVMPGQWDHNTQRHWLKLPYLVEDGAHQHISGTPSSLSRLNSAPYWLTHSSRYIWSGLAESGSNSASELSLTLRFYFQRAIFLPLISKFLGKTHHSSYTRAHYHKQRALIMGFWAEPHTCFLWTVWNLNSRDNTFLRFR